jgi:hypothetical protein
MIVYRVTNRCNGKIYIGKTSKTAHQRFQRHVQEAFSKSRLGKRNFYFHRAIVKHGKHRQKILGRKLSKEHKQAISDGNKGKKLSKETKEKISLMNSGSKNGNYRKPESLESRNARGRSISLAKRAGVAPKRDCNAERLSVAARERVSEKVSARVKNEMVDLYDRGSVTKQEISDMYNIPFRSVVQILRYWKGVRERLKSRPSKDQKDKVVKLRKEGRSYDEISECVNLPKNKVVNIFKVYSRNCKRA